MQTNKTSAATTTSISTSNVRGQDPTSALTLGQNESTSILGSNSQMKQYLGPFDSSFIPDFPKLEVTGLKITSFLDSTFSIIELYLGTTNFDMDNITLFEANYEEHCLEVVNAVSELNFAR